METGNAGGHPKRGPLPVATIVLMVFFAILGLFLILEHPDHLLSWLPFLIIPYMSADAHLHAPRSWRTWRVCGAACALAGRAAPSALTQLRKGQLFTQRPTKCRRAPLSLLKLIAFLSGWHLRSSSCNLSDLRGRMQPRKQFVGGARPSLRRGPSKEGLLDE